MRPVLADAAEVARRALVELEPDGVGTHLGVTAEDETAATHRFEASLPGYRGWQWAVVVAAPPGAESATVSESALLPGPDALIAPDFIPWDQRVRPGDLGPGDLLAPPTDDPRLVPGYVATGDPVVDDVAREVGLGRVQVLSLEGRVDAAQRWYTEYGPDTEMAKAAPSTCGLCGFYVPLAGALRESFGVCANSMGADGHVVHVEYGCGAHSDVVAPSGNGSPRYEAFDDHAVEYVEVRASSGQPGTDQPAGEQSSSETASTDQPADEQPSAETASAEQPTTETTVAEASAAQSADDQQTAEAAAVEATAAEHVALAEGTAPESAAEVVAAESASTTAEAGATDIAPSSVTAEAGPVAEPAPVVSESEPTVSAEADATDPAPSSVATDAAPVAESEPTVSAEADATDAAPSSATVEAGPVAESAPAEQTATEQPVDIETAGSSAITTTEADVPATGESDPSPARDTTSEPGSETASAEEAAVAAVESGADESAGAERAGAEQGAGGDAQAEDGVDVGHGLPVTR